MPAPETATAAPESGETSLIASLEAGLTSPVPATAVAAPASAPAPAGDAVKPAGGEKSADTKPAATKPPVAGSTPPKAAVVAKPTARTEQALDWKTAPKQFKEAHEKLKVEYEQTKTELQGKLTSVEIQMRALEGRKFWTPEEEEKYKALEARQQALESDLYSRDYQASPEFKDKYEKPANKVFDLVSRELKDMTITETVDGSENQRQATMADFNRVRSLGNSLSQQRRMAKELFGDDADIILGHARKLADLEEAANSEVDSRRSAYSDNKKQDEQKQKQTETEYSQNVSQFDKLLVERFPEYFGEDATNPAFNTALKEGTEFIKKVVTGASAMTLAERAQKNAIVQRWASSWPANQVRIKSLSSRVAELEAEITKLRGSDPGAGGEGGGGAGSAEESGGGTDGLAADIEKMSRQAGV